ncbi:ABC transporter permease [Termitidicoccus mucosus]|uniref:ABC transporter permease n=1 Tax=Termitidicoccus mucosus TaxID=1184151 RepID=A0A178IER0_9BACT|nr:ABC transporter permease [Opitutaceae bacterium TSB47]
MLTNLKIALRFLLAKRRSMMMSLTGIAFGVGFIILTQAVTTGFQEFFIRTILGTDGALRVEDKFQATVVNMSAIDSDGRYAGGVEVESNRKYQEGVAEPGRLIDAIKRFPDVSGVSEVLRGNVSIQSATREESGQVYGIELENHMAVSDIGRQIVVGNMDDFRKAPAGVLVGSALANRLRLRPGNSVLISYGGQSTRYRVSAIYETGIRDIDKVRVFMHLGEARVLLHKPYGASYLQVGLKNSDRAPEIARQIEMIASHRAASWQEREKVWLDVFRFFRILAAITVFTIIVVSGLGMFNTLAMIVMEKTREIAILRSMGYTRMDIAFVFMLQGGLVLAAGIALGWMFGALSTWGVSSVPVSVRGIFSTDHIVVAWDFAHYAGAALASSVVVLIASWMPARRAALLEPAAIIRGASQ